jgi:mono/diheme cytochrome c family protein
MTTRKKRLWILSFAAVALILAALAPRIAQAYWSARSSNPVRRGVARATELGCFSCHGDLGSVGLPDPGKSDYEVPGWSGGVWMMYVKNDDEIRNYILYGSRTKPVDASDELHAHGSDDDGGDTHSHQDDRHAEQAIHMPAYEEVLDSGDLDDLVAAFLVLSGMSLPPSDSAERRGYDVARRWRCFSCHGAAGSGGYSNPASFAGFIPGWYGADFRDLVRNREEFDGWIRDGSIARLLDNRIASFFIRRQAVPMPAYNNLTPRDRDDLWAYVQWLERTDGGTEGGANPW